MKPLPRTDATKPAVGRTGRPFDHSSDATILATALDLVGERGYDRLTLDEVAARTGKAKTTLYRRWATKEDLALAAIRSIGRPPEVDALPDHGSLRSDLIAVVDSTWLGGSERRLAVFAGLASATRSSASLGDVVRSEVTEPYVEVYRRILERAAERGEILAGMIAKIPVVAEVVPAMSTHRLNAVGETAPRDFYVTVIDDIVLPALGVAS
ncbi:hypothetical protein AX769_17810 [Frondihabitans sp. PAMC 28766]|uniref:TetR/AcrR family transcriptional regulator n=1 Tax=Frondihabitans sp. PAMC 28766 TaxID=1795630 RepID=UPI00078D8F76|nr:TetR/AcrR family transcriptional regulator [Frondihabitans sp. PAMC 28766]AMM21662.1 hypothetical protein AX769_17810 [Frondihabitans sp. PAMC 28766]